MLFSTFTFALFFLIVFIIYWLVINQNLTWQNIFLLASSYFFYGFWDVRFLFLLFGLSLTNYFLGLAIGNKTNNSYRKIWLTIGLIINISVLGLFKYYNFFVDAFISIVRLIGYDLPEATTNIVLPLGISFYVFLSLSYIIDIYRGNLTGKNNIFDVLLALSFFPIILAGPIQRPSSLLPQISQNRLFDKKIASDGLKQILWGLFAKIVIADRLSYLVDDIFLNIDNNSGSTLLLGAIFFSVQIYADFSGYSNMAIGIAKLLGFNLMQNFNYPYFSRDITEFWKKWHISLTTWFRDYLFLPLSFNLSWKITKSKVLFLRSEMLIYMVASLITWLLTGLWHGANYTFVIWGLFHGCLLIFYNWQKKPRKILLKKTKINNDNFLLMTMEVSLTLLFIIITWIFFRVNNIGEATLYLRRVFSLSLFTLPSVIPMFTMISILVFFIVEWFGRKSDFAIAVLGLKFGKAFRYTFYYGISIMIIWFIGIEQEFIYFQF